MGKRGPAKQPQQLIDLKGTTRKDRRRSEAMVGQKITSLSQVESLCNYTHLSEQGQKIFLRQCIFLIGLKVLEASELEMLMLYAQNYDLALRLMDEMNEADDLSKVQDQMRNFDKICKTINSIGTQFGFTPASRIRMTVPEPEKKADVMDIASDAIEI